ncbi:class II aldolase/adducin family protein [Luedemannella flava]
MEVLRQAVLRANQLIPKAGLAALTWGNVSGVDREAGLYVIKPSGVAYEDLTEDLLVPVDLATGAVLAGDLRLGGQRDAPRVLSAVAVDRRRDTRTPRTRWRSRRPRWTSRCWARRTPTRSTGPSRWPGN